MADHWVAMFPKYGGPWNTLQALNAAPHVKGVLRRIIWRDLYRSDKPALDSLWSYIEYVKSKGKKLSLMIEDKTFDGSHPLPDYLRSYEVPTRSNGFCAIRWHPKVMAEYNKIVCMIAAHPDVHSISIMETACGISGEQLRHHGYTPELYSNMYIDLIKDLNRAKSGMPVFWHQNFFPMDSPGEYIDRAIEAVRGLNTLRLGGPDWWPTDGALMKRAYPRYAEWKAKGVPTFTMMSSPSFMQYVEGAFLSPRELLDGAIALLKCNNIFWCFTRTPPAVGAYSFYDATHLMQPTVPAQQEYEP